MLESGFYAIYTVATGEVVMFHNYSLEERDVPTVPFVSEPHVSYIEVSGNLNSYRGKERDYVVSEGALVPIDAEARFELLKKMKDIEVSEKYLIDITWTDDARMFYLKYQEAFPGDSKYDSWYADVIQYWKEGREAREKNKSDLIAATTEHQVQNIEYVPRHSKNKNEIQ